MKEPVLAGPEVIDQTALQAVGITMVILASLIFGARTYLVIIKRRMFAWEDGWLIAGYVFFVVTSSLYIYLAPFIFKLQHLGEGRIPMYPTFLDDVVLCRSTFFFTSIGLSLCLWCIKASLLSLYKRLLEGGAQIFKILWWIVVGIALLVCICAKSDSTKVSSLTECGRLSLPLLQQVSCLANQSVHGFRRPGVMLPRPVTLERPMSRSSWALPATSLLTC